MANVGKTITDYFTNTVEITGNSMASVDDWFEVSAHGTVSFIPHVVVAYHG